MCVNGYCQVGPTKLSIAFPVLPDLPSSSLASVREEVGDHIVRWEYMSSLYLLYTLTTLSVLPLLLYQSALPGFSLSLLFGVTSNWEVGKQICRSHLKKQKKLLLKSLFHFKIQEKLPVLLRPFLGAETSALKRKPQ